MTTKRIFLGLVGGIVLVGGWFAFRPERLFLNQSVNETFPVASATAGPSGSRAPVALRTGTFHSVAHDGMGRATVYELPGGQRVLRLTEFTTSNGPDTRLYLVAAPDASDNAAVTTAGFLDLGAVKGNIGDQNYDLPAGVDLDRYRAVTVWCRRFGVNFTTAPLAPTS